MTVLLGAVSFVLLPHSYAMVSTSGQSERSHKPLTRRESHSTFTQVDPSGYEIFHRDVLGSHHAFNPRRGHDDPALSYEYHTYNQMGFANTGKGQVDTFASVVRKESQEAQEEQRPFVLMEIGVWLGKSIAKWLETDQNVHVIGIDPFDTPKFNESTHQFNQRLANYVVQHESHGSSGRYALITGFSPEAAKPFLHKKKLPIDMFYIDGGKIDDHLQFSKYLTKSLDTFYDSNPNALFSGDDWVHKKTPTLQPILTAFAAQNHLQLAESRNQWLMGNRLDKRLIDTPVTFVVKNHSDYKGPTIEQILAKLKSEAQDPVMK